MISKTFLFLAISGILFGFSSGTVAAPFQNSPRNTALPPSFSFQEMKDPKAPQFNTLPTVNIKSNSPPSVAEVGGGESKWKALFQTQADLLTQSLNGLIQPLVVDTDDPSMHAFVWNDLIKRPEAAESQESGLAGMYIGGGKINGHIQPMCYILYRYQKAGSTQRLFMTPLTEAYGENIAAAFLMGHEMGHCLDFQQRQGAIPKQALWNGSQASQIGISDVAFTRVFGVQMNEDLYLNKFLILENDLAQKQYQERIADIFGVFWAWTQGMPEKGIDIIRQSRDHQAGDSDHNTEDALVGLEGFYNQVMQNKGNIQTLWNMARQIQEQKGVTPEAVAWQPANQVRPLDQINSAAIDANSKTNPNDFSQTDPTVLFGTSKKTEIQIIKPPKPQNNSGPKNFDSLPRFGQ